MSLPRALMPTPRQRFWVITDDGIEPLLGSMSFYIAGTTTPTPVFADAQSDTELGTVVNMTDDGYCPAIYLPREFGVKVVLTDEPDGAGAIIYTQDNVEDPGSEFLATWGNIQTEGSKDVTTGYEITGDDNLVTVNEPTVDPAVIVLQAASERGTPLIVKNKSSATTVALTPQGVETIDDVVGAFTLPVAASPTFPTVTLLSDGVSNYYIASSHGL